MGDMDALFDGSDAHLLGQQQGGMMPDISMCQNENCTNKLGCYRFMAFPYQYQQAYAAFAPDETECDDYLPLNLEQARMVRIAREAGQGGDFVARVLAWNAAAGNSADHFNARQAALYFGLQLEEIGEKLLEVIAGLDLDSEDMPEQVRLMRLMHLRDVLHDVSEGMKAGTFDAAMANADRVALLDADCDIAVVTVGSMMSQGADVAGALAEVCDSNDSKGVPCAACDGMGYADGTGCACGACNGRGWGLDKDANGKVIKGPAYVEPNLLPFTCREEDAA